MNPSPSTFRSRAHLRRGFTLIELVIAIAIVAVLAGAAIPVTSKMLTYKARKATREELQVLGDAALDHFRDTRTIPTAISNLVVDAGASGWAGPYLGGAVTDQLTGSSGFEVDAWSRAYRFSVSGDQLTIASRAEDANFGSADDLAIVVDVGVARREETVDELTLLNQAVNAYNATYLASAPLASVWATAYSTLVTRGYLPSYTGYLTDGWDQAYVAVGSGGPLVELTSTNLAQSQAGNGNGNGGNGNNGNGNNGKNGKNNGNAVTNPKGNAKNNGNNGKNGKNNGNAGTNAKNNVKGKGAKG